MDFPQQPQGTTPFPAAPQASTPPPFPNVGGGPLPTPMATSNVVPSMPEPAGPMPGATMPPLGSSVPPAVQIPVQSHPAAAFSSSEEQVYTMPDKFLASATPAAMRTKKPHKAMTMILIVVIVLMLLAAVGGVLYYFLVLAKNQPIETTAQNAVVVNNANTVVNDNINNANTNNSNVNGLVNTNANDNVNTVPNANTNAVANTNTTNTNATNTNVNNANTNANTNTTTTGVVPPAAKDTDQDDLTNDEEAIWVTKADLPDTDNDGYLDGAEILAGYDPTNAASAGRLADSALISSFANSQYSYSMLYPKNWLAEALAEGDSTEVLFTPNTLDLTGQFVAVTVTTNPTGLTALDWYSNTANIDEADLELVTSFSGVTGVWSTDHTTAYYADSDYVYAISYRYGNSAELYFPTSFEMMVKSFQS